MKKLFNIFVIGALLLVGISACNFGPVTDLSDQPAATAEPLVPKIGGGEWGLGWPFVLRPFEFNNSIITLTMEAVIVQPDYGVEQYEVYFAEDVQLLPGVNEMTLTFGSHILEMHVDADYQGNINDLDKVSYRGALSNNKTIKVRFGEQWLMPQAMSTALHEATLAYINNK